MKSRSRTFALILLIFNGISAVGGGLGLIVEPGGESFQMPRSLLEHTPFHNFLIPGIILLTMNGLLSLTIAILVLRRVSLSAWLVMVQGCILLGWILTQIALIREYAPLMHTLYLVVGLLLVLSGILMKSKN